MSSAARSALLPLLALAAAVLVALAAGCSKDHLEIVRDVLPINAIAFADSVGGGDTLALKVQYTFTRSCDQNAQFEVATLGDSDYLVVPVARHRSDDPCTGLNGVNVATLLVTSLGQGARTFHVEGANDTLLARVTASRDTGFVKDRGIVFRVLVEDAATGAPIPNADVRIENVDSSQLLIEAPTDAQGRLELDQVCGPDLSYRVAVSVGGRSTILVVRTPPARCGVPEAVVIHV